MCRPRYTRKPMFNHSDSLYPFYSLGNRQYKRSKSKEQVGSIYLHFWLTRTSWHSHGLQLVVVLFLYHDRPRVRSRSASGYSTIVFVRIKHKHWVANAHVRGWPLRKALRYRIKCYTRYITRYIWQVAYSRYSTSSKNERVRRVWNICQWHGRRTYLPSLTRIINRLGTKQ
jgi:hypothetical protein